MGRLVVENLKLNYPSFALDVSFTVEAGEFVSIIGPSGSGKSTILSALTALIDIDGGKLTLDGRDITKLKTQERDVGLVFQDYALFDNMNVGKNIAYPMKIKKVPSKEIKRRVSDILTFVGLEGYEKRKINTLSGGEAQRVALARAISGEPELLLLDEPLSAIDAAMRGHLRDEIRRIHDESGKMSTIYVTHDREEAFGISDRIIVMRGGKIEMIGTPEEVYRKPKTLFTAFFSGEGTALHSAFFGFNSLVSDTFFFRPEDVIVKEDQFYGDLNSYLRLDGVKVVSSEFKGAYYMLGLVYREQMIIASVPDRPERSEVTLYVKKSKILFYKNSLLVD